MPPFSAEISQDVYPDLVMPDLRVMNSKQVLQCMAEKAAEQLPVASTKIYDMLIAEERDGSSAIGDGVAIPHLKIKQLDRAFCALATLSNEVDFDSPDGEPVNLVCLLISPEQEAPFHLRRLSRLSRLLKNDDIRSKIVNMNDADTIRSVMTDPEGWMLAA